MAKPRIFISSPFIDLKQIRNSLRSFISEIGYEPIVFEDGMIPFHPSLPIDESCYREIENCDMLILIIGKKYGSPASNTSKLAKSNIKKDKMHTVYNSVTKKEYLTARENGIPVFIFVPTEVYGEYLTYISNKNNISVKYSNIDSLNIYKFIESIYNESYGNYIVTFDFFEDIKEWLKKQWAGLFAHFLSNDIKNFKSNNLNAEIEELRKVNKELQEFTENLVKKINKQDYQEILNQQDEKMLHNKISRFMREEFIRYLKTNFFINISEADFFNIYRDSNNLKEFLKKLSVDSLSIDKLSKFEGAEKEFQKYKDKYVEV